MKYYHFVVFVFLVLLMPLGVGCRTMQSTVSNQLHTESHVAKAVSAKTINQLSRIKDAVSYRDSVRYRERIVNDTVYIETEVKVYVDRDKAVHDTVYINVNDSTSVKDDTSDTDNQETTVVKQPSLWERFVGKVGECATALLLLLLLLWSIRTIIRRVSKK